MDTSTDHPPLRTCKAIGADAGGTKLALAITDGNRTWHARYPSVNLRTVSVDAFASQLSDYINEALGPLSLDAGSHLCIGAAGAGTEAVAAACAEALGGCLGLSTEQIRVTSDARIALEAAFTSQPGILVIAGTGSGCYGLDAQGRMLRAGGWGPGLGDPGSGTNLGRSALRALLAHLEAQSTGAFDLRVAAAMGIGSPAIAAVLDACYAADFHPSSLAPTVLDLFEEGDGTAERLVQAECTALAEQCARLVRRLALHGAPPVVLAGGLSHRKSYLEAFATAVRLIVPEAQVQPMTTEPVNGALQWAIRDGAQR